MAIATGFNLKEGQQAERKLLVTCVNVGTTPTKEWQVIGAGIEESAIELNPEVETKTDILGLTSTIVKKMEPKQTMEPFTITGGSKLAFKLYDQIKRSKRSELSMYEVMQIHAYVGEAGKFDAEIHKNCTIVVNSIGGSATVDMPIEINYSNDKTHGTVDKYKASETIVFTPEASVPANG